MHYHCECQHHLYTTDKYIFNTFIPSWLEFMSGAARTLVKSYSMSHEAAAQAAGYERIRTLKQAIKKSASQSAISNTSDDTSSNETAPTLEELARKAEAAARNCVKSEIQAYENAGLWEETAPLDLLRFWQICAHSCIV